MKQYKQISTCCNKIIRKNHTKIHLHIKKLHTAQNPPHRSAQFAPSENGVFHESLLGDSDDGGGCNLRDFLGLGFGERAEAVRNLGADDLSDANSFFYLQTHTHTLAGMCARRRVCAGLLLADNNGISRAIMCAPSPWKVKRFSSLVCARSTLLQDKGWLCMRTVLIRGLLFADVNFLWKLGMIFRSVVIMF